MKIHQLPLGARFEYEGAEYIKTGPLFATGPGGQRLIPRSAVLRPLGDGTQTSSQAPVGPSKAQVLAAFDVFCAATAPLVPADRQAELATARERFLAALG